MIYLASPYTHPDPHVQSIRYMAALNWVAYSVTLEIPTVYSPIVHYHHVANAHELPGDFDFWMNHGFQMLRLCEMLFVLTLGGWRDSKGVTAEITEAKRIGIPVNHVSPV